jgi:hypothetical protein
MRTPRSTRSSTPSEVSAGRGGTPGRVRGFTRGAPRVRPGSARGVPLGVRPSTSGAIPGRSRGVPGHACRGPLRARVPAASRTTRGTRRRTTARGPGHVRPCEAGPRTTGWVRPVHDPGGPRPEPTAPGSDHARPAPDSDRTGPTRAGQGGAGPAGPPRARPRARPGERPAYDRGGPPPCMTCAGSARVRPRGSAPVHDRAGLGPCTTVRGSNCARPCGARTVHHRAGLGLCTTVRGSGRVRPGRLSPGYDRTGSWTLYDREGPPRVGSRGSAPAQTVRSRAAYDRARRRPRTARAGFACVRPCGACPAYDPVRGFDHVRPEGPLRSAR